MKLVALLGAGSGRSSGHPLVTALLAQRRDDPPALCFVDLHSEDGELREALLQAIARAPREGAR